MKKHDHVIEISEIKRLHKLLLMDDGQTDQEFDHSL